MANERFATELVVRLGLGKAGLRRALLSALAAADLQQAEQTRGAVTGPFSARSHHQARRKHGARRRSRSSWESIIAAMVVLGIDKLALLLPMRAGGLVAEQVHGVAHVSDGGPPLHLLKLLGSLLLVLLELGGSGGRIAGLNTLVVVLL
ncbi:hypothetical protein M406DRAFT_356353 [Cryphonectria parasitica EP155]|uniref:Uncharacterized protein n=1 Tax=Cryphonectria parasitica (strain ATCC 38755 / EP155) TaxID=660469 RepID=A0A9P5CPH0_CRYP1|nr:uncharacterized protein M406DRAFT_356353 [Cryphonectria parasitica EP155]KAF3766474.1 hypothetical protein M406DRAFT_356353 [Cryphonectria parasitica EP155]